jgi:FtsP/CotA-like multicopper oxidase with cupredoxin domain
LTDRLFRFGLYTVALALVVSATVVARTAPTPKQEIARGAATQACVTPDRTVTLYAEMVGGHLGYGRTPDTAHVPGPTLTMYEGECMAVKLINQTDGPASVHAHGVDYTVDSDGTPLTQTCTPAGGTRTYVFAAHKPVKRGDGTVDNGSAGYWHYHDHCRGSDHGTEGIQRGLFGAFIVRRTGDPLPDRGPFVIVFTDDSINLKLAPETPIFYANEGERVEFVVIAHANSLHTFHLHGHRWADTRTGLAEAAGDEVRSLDNHILGPADSFGFQVVAGEHVGQGAWMYHCHVQFHADGGMSGLFVVRSPSGQVSPKTQAAIDRFMNMHSSASMTPTTPMGH